MHKIITIALFCFAAAAAYELVEDDEGQEYLLVPLHRQKRQTSVDISGGGRSGTTVTAGHQGTILDKNGYRLDGGAFASKQFHPNGPATIGGQLGYTHTPSGSNLNLGASHTQKYGTDLNLQGVGNLWRNGNSRLDAVGNYGRHYGGPGGTGRPNYYGGLQFNHRF